MPTANMKGRCAVCECWQYFAAGDPIPKHCNSNLVNVHSFTQEWDWVTLTPDNRPLAPAPPAPPTETRLVAIVIDESCGQRRLVDCGEFHAVYGGEGERSGVWIGSAEDCHVRLSAHQNIGSRHVRHCAKGHHQFLDVRDPTGVVVCGEVVRPGDYCRIDNQWFTVGTCRIRVQQVSRPVGVSSEPWPPESLLSGDERV